MNGHPINYRIPFREFREEAMIIYLDEIIDRVSKLEQGLVL